MYMRLSLKAQSQSRTTCEALSEIKNPRQVAFVKQANIATNQQVNNGISMTDTRAREKTIDPEQSKVLEHQHGERLDIRAPSTAGRAHTRLAAVGKINGT